MGALPPRSVLAEFIFQLHLAHTLRDSMAPMSSELPPYNLAQGRGDKTRPLAEASTIILEIDDTPHPHQRTTRRGWR